MRLPIIAFSPVLVTVVTVLAYAVLIVFLLYTHHVVPEAPTWVSTYPAVDIAGAWQDLQVLSSRFHHYNTRRNDEVRNWLLRRIETLLKSNNASFRTEPPAPGVSSPAPVVIFNDMVSNVTMSQSRQSVYFEGTNIMVYIRGTEDDDRDWWKDGDSYEGQGGVLVNAHYDSVSTGFGATDDGMGVVTILQLISHFISEGKRPKRGIVALLNNGEEDWLNGANAFTRHPLSAFPRSFLNLEGAGSGGRSTLFRSTDTEVTKAYESVSYPFGSAVSSDGFKRRLIRSGTDYSVFTSTLGLRGLDVAFMEPRSNYHTTRDNTKHASIDSLWHMLSGALATVETLASASGFTFNKPDPTHIEGSEGVWFDLFGQTFAVFRLTTLFAVSVTLLVAAPIILITLTVMLSRAERWYPFSRKQRLQIDNADDTIPGLPLDGLRGFFRPIVTMIVSTAVAVALAFLVAKINPYVIYSHRYTVWAMILTGFTTVAWFCLRGADFTRPTSLQRFYSLLWMYIISYILLVGVTILERNLDIAGVYFLVIYNGAVFVALFISYCELFALPKKSEYAQLVVNSDGLGGAESIASSRAIPPRSQNHSRSRERPTTADTDENANENTSLLRNDRGTTFAGYGGATRERRASGQASSTLIAAAAFASDDEALTQTLGTPYPNEQPWSARLPSWLWILQFLLVCPIPVILTGQIALLLTSALHQTPADGNPVLPIYLFIAGLTYFLLAPLLPFLHRFHYHIPSLLALIFIATLIFNLLAPPFTESNRLKTYFYQTIDLDTGENYVSLTGIPDYIHSIASSVPSASGKDLHCGEQDLAKYAGLSSCHYPGPAPRVVKNQDVGLPESTPPELGYKDWLSYNVSRAKDANSARFEIRGKNTRACRILFDRPISNFSVEGGALDSRFEPVGEDGSDEVRLWSREWERGWNVTVEWKDDDENEEGSVEGRGVSSWEREDRTAHARRTEQGGEKEIENGIYEQEVGRSKEREAGGMDGKVVCLWSDANEAGAIPALEELWQYMPNWSTAVKGDDGLVIGFKRFAV
ncbi:MAG: hypothetical protein M1820_007104 [Bogoriella megaspora]|nr:MAG: hypothetical protein M1820_007104 [Bogoriella megaspora]